MIVFAIASFFNYSLLLHAELISTAAGRAGDVVVTSREVVIGHLVESALYAEGKPPATIKLNEVRSREFIRETTAALIEVAVDLESKIFQGTKFFTTKELIAAQSHLALKRLKYNKDWKRLEVSSKEVEQIVGRKLRSKEFIKFKISSSTIPISDKEAEGYFKANPSKFENLAFESFKDNIKGFLTKQQLDHRMKDWLELLQRKYHVRNFLAE